MIRQSWGDVYNARRRGRLGLVGGLVLAVAVGLAAPPGGQSSVVAANTDTIAQRKNIFRFDTFGDEQLGTDRLRLHEVIESSLGPETALDLGLQVEVDALPDALKGALQRGEVDLTDPTVTVALIKLNAVVGVVGKVEKIRGRDRLVEVGITCALCHSTVDDSFATGIGKRLDGSPNLDLDPGRIIAASPAVPEVAKTVYRSWGPGFYDPRFNIDGKSTPLVLPPAYGLAKVAKETYTGEGPISYWNAYVAKCYFGSFWVNGFFEMDTQRGKVTRLFEQPPPKDNAAPQEVTYHGVEAVYDHIVLAANEGRSYLDAVDVASGQLLDRLTEVSKPCCVERVPGTDPVRVLVSNSGNGSLQLVEVSKHGKLKSLGQAQVGKAPKRVAFVPTA